MSMTKCVERGRGSWADDGRPKARSIFETQTNYILLLEKFAYGFSEKRKILLSVHT